jgi:hypothetical protein
MGFSVLGKEGFQIVSLFTGAIKFLFVFPMLFNLNFSTLVTTPRLLFDYFVTSQIAGNTQVCGTSKYMYLYVYMYACI